MQDDTTTVPEHEERIDDVLRNAFQGECARGREPVFHRTPLSDLVAAEEGVPSDEFAIRKETMSSVLEFIFSEGPHPGHVMRRVYALCRVYRSDLLMNMPLEDIGMMLGETRAAQSWRIDKLFSNYLKKMGFRGNRLPWQKPDETRAKFKEAAKGNHNRRGKHAKRASKKKS